MPIPVGVIHGLKTCSSRSEEEETHTSPPPFPSEIIQQSASTVYPLYDNSDSET